MVLFLLRLERCYEIMSVMREGFDCCENMESTVEPHR